MRHAVPGRSSHVTHAWAKWEKTSKPGRKPTKKKKNHVTRELSARGRIKKEKKKRREQKKKNHRSSSCVVVWYVCDYGEDPPRPTDHAVRPSRGERIDYEKTGRAGLTYSADGTFRARARDGAKTGRAICRSDAKRRSTDPVVMVVAGGEYDVVYSSRSVFTRAHALIYYRYTERAKCLCEKLCVVVYQPFTSRPAAAAAAFKPGERCVGTNEQNVRARARTSGLAAVENIIFTVRVNGMNHDVLCCVHCIHALLSGHIGMCAVHICARSVCVCVYSDCTTTTIII